MANTPRKARRDPHEKPILFNGEMVRAILAGKTQTRRVVKAPFVIDEHPETGALWPLCPSYCNDGDNEGQPISCPFGSPGDRLWVREAWWRGVSGGLEGYAADCHRDGPDNTACRKIPSIHMPRWASRLLLTVTDVRVQRIQDISEQDVLAEGIKIDRERVARMQVMAGVDPAANIQASFAALWDRINGQRATWSSNPWVWAISFEVTK